jgi:ferric-dicitrate binding protein FerR (iron transport regulator)
MNNRSWFLLSKKLSGNATDAELSELDDLLAEQPEWQYAIDQLQAIWAANKTERGSDDDFSAHITRMANNGVDTAIFKENEALIPTPVYSIKRKLWIGVSAIAAAVVIGFACWIIFQPESEAGSPAAPGLASNKNIIKTKAGQRRKMILPDGTQVWLNAESTLEYNAAYGKTNRDVALSGEGFFDVVKNASMPFTIQTNKIHVKVTGTAFNVKAYPGEKTSETSLIRGKVEVTINARPEEKYILKPNEKLVVRDESVSTTTNDLLAEKKPEPLIELGYVNFVPNDSAAIETSWVYDRLIFDDELLSDIARKMERWYGVHITITDAAVASQQLTYTIKRETISQALDNMRYAIRFHYIISGNNITITR